MSKNILLVVESVSNELDVDKETIFEAVESALASVIAKKFEEGADISVVLDRDTGLYEAFRRWEVVSEDSQDDDEEISAASQLTLEQARDIDAKLEIGDFVEEKVEAESFGRIGAHQAKQVVARIVREAGRAKVAEAYKKRIGELLTGQVRRVGREGIVVDLGYNVEGRIPRDKLVGRESFRVGDRVRAYLYSVQQDMKGLHILLSRTHPKLLARLFEVEVPEIAEHVITIESVARDPGVRAKIAVKTNDGRIDPVGACLGIRCTRVQAVSEELNGERIEVVLWDSDPAQFVINALAPVEVVSILVDEQARSMDVAVSEDQLSKAIGRSGQNVNLATRLTGWTLNMMSEATAAEEGEKHRAESISHLVEALNIGEDVAELLVQEGFSSVEEVAYVSLEELTAIEGFDEDIVNELRDRAKIALVEKAITETDSRKDGTDLLKMEGITSDLVEKLKEKGVLSREALADLSVSDIIDIDGLDKDLAAKLIMEARAPWFDEDGKD